MTTRKEKKGKKKIDDEPKMNLGTKGGTKVEEILIRGGNRRRGERKNGRKAKWHAKWPGRAKRVNEAVGSTSSALKITKRVLRGIKVAVTAPRHLSSVCRDCLR